MVGARAAGRARRDRGLTLIEVMIALVVTTVALLGALATVGMTVRGAAFSRSTSEATVLVQSQLEALVSQTGVTATSPADGTQTIETQLDGNGMTNTVTGQYTRTTTWGTITDATGQRRLVTVRVQWPDAIDSTKTHQVIAVRQKDPQ
jgi:prepilin-type N-terminal cleavage/methylation domain-containing protein